MIKIMNSDVYNICNRVKDIDKNYYIVFNTSNSKFELHNTSQLGSSYCLTVPYDNLDVRLLNYIHKTKNTNIEIILNEIERDNKIRENSEKNAVLSDFNASLERVLKNRR